MYLGWYFKIYTDTTQIYSFKCKPWNTFFSFLANNRLRNFHFFQINQEYIRNLYRAVRVRYKWILLFVSMPNGVTVGSYEGNRRSQTMCLLDFNCWKISDIPFRERGTNTRGTEIQFKIIERGLRILGISQRDSSEGLKHIWTTPDLEFWYFTRSFLLIIFDFLKIH